MSTTLSKEIQGVRAFLNDPLPNAPSTEAILIELEAEYQNVSNIANNLGVSWSICELVLPLVAGTFDYCLSDLTNYFYKPAHAEVLPVGIELGSEVDGKEVTVNYSNALKTSPGIIEFTEIERLPIEYQWLDSVGGQLFYNSRYSFYLSFYRQVHNNIGEKHYVRVSPIPTRSGINIKILFQTTDWWDKLFNEVSTETEKYQQKLPHSSHRMLFRALVAKNLILSGKVKWGNDSDKNNAKSMILVKGLEDRITRYSPSFNDYITSLEDADSVVIEPWDNNEFK